MSATLEFEHVSKWFRDTVAVGDVSFAIGPGITGLLGHNGAGKSTAIRLAAGLASPDEGSVRILGRDPRRHAEARAALGLVPDGDALWSGLSAQAFVAALARLRGVDDPAAAAARALAAVDLTGVADRRVAGFSQGMRQRVKIAQALVHDPSLLILDEPLNGLDPAQREATIALLRQRAATGTAVLFSSHILDEVERIADRVLVLVNGRLVAKGATPALRALLEERPRRIRIRTDGEPHALAAALAADPACVRIAIDDRLLEVETTDAHGLAVLLPTAARASATRLVEITPSDEDLESVYGYLTERSRGVRR
jgi:ABC-2 type transport system ATP-binding protein